MAITPLCHFETHVNVTQVLQFSNTQKFKTGSNVK